MSSPVQDLSLRHHRREQGLMLALALPALLVILLLIVLPVGWLAWQSIYHDGFTLENYRRILSEDIYWRSFALTFEISLLVTLLALLLGYPIAYAASAAPKGWSILILALVVLPFWTSVLVRAYAWLALLQRTGVINQLLQSSRRHRRAAGAGPQHASAPSSRPCISCCRSWCCRSTPPCRRSRAI